MPPPLPIKNIMIIKIKKVKKEVRDKKSSNTDLLKVRLSSRE
jgi:hypothetical protein